jgi:serine protease
MSAMRTRLGTAFLLGIALAAVTPAVAGAAAPTGRYLVVFKRQSAVRSATAVLARAGVRRAGPGVPQLRMATVRGSAGALRALRRDPTVASVSPEYARDLRRAPNDPALSTPETEFGGLPGGAPVEWELARERFPQAWDVTTGAGALVGVIDTGIDGAHPELAGKIAFADVASASDPRSDPDGHGTHLSGLACASTDNGLGVAGAGWGCRIALVKVPSPAIPDEAIVDGIRIATDRGAQSINMSFGGGPPTPALDNAIEYAYQHGVVLVAAASNDQVSDQGAPASQLQPGNAPDINAGRGLVVTAADFSDRRPSTGFGPQISLAAYGFFSESSGPPGLVSTYPGPLTDRDVPDCTPVVLPSCPRRDLGGDSRYAYLEGTSMSVPQVSALAALVADLNPRLSIGEKLRLLKQTARRAGGWSPDAGWGIVDAGNAVEAARRVDHMAPTSKVRGKRRARPPKHRRRAAVRLRWSGNDPAGGRALISAGLRSFDLYLRRGHGRYRRIRHDTRRRTALVRLRPGVYRFYSRALDKAGNREAPPQRADLRLVVRRR